MKMNSDEFYTDFWKGDALVFWHNKFLWLKCSICKLKQISHVLPHINWNLSFKSFKLFTFKTERITLCIILYPKLARRASILIQYRRLMKSKKEKLRKVPDMHRRGTWAHFCSERSQNVLHLYLVVTGWMSKHFW
jgi:hypothetical protein